MTCTPFDPQGAEIFELVGTLRIDRQQGEPVLILDGVNLRQSRQMLGEELEPIPTGTFKYAFP
jgi:hypothetical protein